MQTLVLFRPMLNDPVVSKFITLLDSVKKTAEDQVNAYCAFASELYQNTDNWSEYLLGLLLRCETPYLKAKAKGQPISELMQLCLDNELDLLSRAARITSAELRAMLDYFDYLPDWKTERFDFAEYYTQRIAELPMRGFGVFSEYACTGVGCIPRPDPTVRAERVSGGTKDSDRKHGGAVGRKTCGKRAAVRRRRNGEILHGESDCQRICRTGTAAH
jgi:hypothetical protein